MRTPFSSIRNCLYDFAQPTEQFQRRVAQRMHEFIIHEPYVDGNVRLRLAERGGKAAKKRAAVAVARRLAVLLHRLWLTGEMYQPLGYEETMAKAA